MVKPSSKVIAKKAAPKKSAQPAPGAIRGDRISVSTSDGKTEKSVSIRKIENGYIVRESTYGPKGQYKECERFSATPPAIDLGQLKKK